MKVKPERKTVMRDEKRQARMREIEAHAYAAFSEAGFEGTSMLAVAKRAKASNETMYRWYGDKNGLFASMVEANAAQVRMQLAAAVAEGEPPLDVLAQVAPVLLRMLLSDRAILLNRAAASDPSGTLGRLLAKGGREDVLPLIAGLLDAAVKAGALQAPQGDNIAALFMRLLVGDQQVRRVIGTLDAPSDAAVEEQAQRALRQLTMLCAA